MELLLLHALPLDGSMWDAQKHLLPGATYAPTLYPLGDTIEDWAAAALGMAKSDRLIVVGCSVGGSCAIEVAALAPERVAALVLIGTKAAHRPDRVLRDSVLQVLREKRLEEAWRTLWAPLFSSSATSQAVDLGRRIAVRQLSRDVARGVKAFHSRPNRQRVLARFPRPVAVVTGADDIAPGMKISRIQADSAPRGLLRIVPNCGHYVPLEQPEALNAILKEVIDLSMSEDSSLRSG